MVKAKILKNVAKILQNQKKNVAKLRVCDWKNVAQVGKKVDFYRFCDIIEIC